MNKFLGHLNTINKHRWKVFCLCVKVGIPIRGLLHDLSKYSPEEFFEGVKYYSGSHSPITDCKKDLGYSRAWLHHKGRNKHHYEYWYDYTGPISTPIIPYKYLVESICDTFAAGMVYNGKSWNEELQLEYWNNVLSKGNIRINENVKKFYTEVYTQVAKNGIDKVLTKNNMRKLYDEIVLQK